MNVLNISCLSLFWICRYFTAFLLKLVTIGIDSTHSHSWPLAAYRTWPGSPALCAESVWLQYDTVFLSLNRRHLRPCAAMAPMVHAYVEDYAFTFSDFRVWIKNQLPGGISLQPNQLSSWFDTISAEAGITRIIILIGRMEYKLRQTCLGSKASKVTFGTGRRIAIVETWP